MLPVELSEVFRVSVTCRQMKDPVLRTVYQRPIGFTKMRYGFGKRIEHSLQVERRAADDLEDLGGRGLLLQRFTQLAATRLYFVEQAHILDGDHRLVSKRRHQLDLLARKWSRRISCHGHNADAAPFSQQRHAKHYTPTTEFLRFEIGVFGIGQCVRNMYHCGRLCDSSGERVSAWSNGMLFLIFLQFARQAITRRHSIDVAVTKKDGRPFRVAKSRC